VKLRVALSVLLFVLVGCASNPTGANRDISGSSSNNVEEKIDVYLLPLDDFPYEFANNLAKRLSEDLKIRVKASLNLGTADLKPYPDSQQYPAEAILAKGKEVAANLPLTDSATTYILLTRRDINSGDRSLRFNFAYGEPLSRMMVLSTARLAASLRNNEMGHRIFWDRTYKMTKRQIGSAYFGYQRSTNIKDLMYSPIMSLEDVDRIGSEFLEQTK